MKRIYFAETLDDIRELQHPARAQGDETPHIGYVWIDTGRLRVVIEHEQVHHNFTVAGFIQLLAEKAGVDVLVK